MASEGPLQAPSQAPEPVETEPEAGTYNYQSRDPATEQTDADSQESADTSVPTVQNNPELAALLNPAVIHEWSDWPKAWSLSLADLTSD